MILILPANIRLSANGQRHGPGQMQTEQNQKKRCLCVSENTPSIMKKIPENLNLTHTITGHR